METNCSSSCEELKHLRRDFELYRDDTEKRLARGDVALATINIKLNWLIAILGAIGTAVLGLLLGSLVK